MPAGFHLLPMVFPHPAASDIQQLFPLRNNRNSGNMKHEGI